MSTELTIKPEQTSFDQRQVAALHQLGFGGNNTPPSPADLDVFFHQCRATGLDPFRAEIFMITRFTKDGPKATIQTGVHGFRKIARRVVEQTKESFGYEDTQWCGADGVWCDIWLSPTPPAAARVTVLRGGQRFSATALFSEYAQTTKDGTPTQMWREKPALMLEKCCEVKALRKAFPDHLSALYSDDEMMQADNSNWQKEAINAYNTGRAAITALPNVETPDEMVESPKRGRPRKTELPEAVVWDDNRINRVLGEAAIMVRVPDLRDLWTRELVSTAPDEVQQQIKDLVESCEAEQALAAA